MPLDQTWANMQLSSELKNGTYTAPTLPIRGRLMTANGSATAAGTEVANSGGSAYSSQDVSTAMAVPSAGSSTNGSAVTFPNLPACTVVGIEFWDSSGTPRRLRYAALAASKTVALNDSITFAASQLQATQS